MEHDGSEAVASNVEEALTAQRHPSSTQAPAVSLGRTSTRDRLPNPVLEGLLHRVLEGDQQAWAEVEQSLGESVRDWLRGHPGKEAACRGESEDDFVSLTFERFRQALTAGQMQASTSLPTVLRYLQACLHGVLLDSLRTKGRSKEIPVQGHANSEEQPEGEGPDAQQLWECIQQLFPDSRERWVAYLVFHCNLSPSDILLCAPQEFRDKQEICHLRRKMLDRILLEMDHMH